LNQTEHILRFTVFLQKDEDFQENEALDLAADTTGMCCEGYLHMCFLLNTFVDKQALFINMSMCD